MPLNIAIKEIYKRSNGTGDTIVYHIIRYRDNQYTITSTMQENLFYPLMIVDTIHTNITYNINNIDTIEWRKTVYFLGAIRCL